MSLALRVLAAANRRGLGESVFVLVTDVRPGEGQDLLAAPQDQEGPLGVVGLLTQEGLAPRLREALLLDAQEIRQERGQRVAAGEEEVGGRHP